MRRGASLLRGVSLLDIDKPYVKHSYINPRRTATSLMTDDGLSLTPRASDDMSTSRGSLRSIPTGNQLLDPSEEIKPPMDTIVTIDSSRQLVDSTIARGNSRSSRQSRLSVRSRDSHVSFRENAQSIKSTASSMTELYYSAVSSSIGSTDTIDKFYSCSESEGKLLRNL